MGRMGLHAGFWWECQKKVVHEEGLDIRGWTMLGLNLEKQDMVVWTELIQWQALVNMVMNPWIP
jgi:hypothetical protein